MKQSEREAGPYPLPRSEVKNAPYSCTSAWHGAPGDFSFAQLLRCLESVMAEPLRLQARFSMLSLLPPPPLHLSNRTPCHWLLSAARMFTTDI